MVIDETTIVTRSSLCLALKAINDQGCMSIRRTVIEEDEPLAQGSFWWRLSWANVLSFPSHCPGLYKAAVTWYETPHDTGD